MLLELVSHRDDAILSFSSSRTPTTVEEFELHCRLEARSIYPSLAA
jgi:hypothetical protein